MPDLSARTVPEHRLTVAELLGLMVADGLVEKADADALIAESRLRRQLVHPLVLIGEQKWKSLLPPHRPLLLDDVGEWLAAGSGEASGAGGSRLGVGLASSAGTRLGAGGAALPASARARARVSA